MNVYIYDYIRQQIHKLCGIFTSKWNKTLKIHFPNLITVKSCNCLLSHNSINSHNILHLNQYMHGHIWSWTVAPFKDPRAVVNGLTGKTMCCWSVFSFLIRAERFRVSTDENLKNWGQHAVGQHLENEASADTGLHLYQIFACFDVANAFLRFAKHFKHTLQGLHLKRQWESQLNVDFVVSLIHFLCQKTYRILIKNLSPSFSFFSIFLILPLSFP
jgi:hypothetical protein